MTHLADLPALIRREHFNLHSLLVERGGDLCLEAYVYPYAPEVLHGQRSIAKSLTAILIGIAFDRGLLPGVEARLVDCLPPRYAGHFDEAKRAIRLGDLLTMRSGLALGDGDTGRIIASPDWAAFCLDAPLVAAPGERFSYATANYTLLAAALHHASGDILAFTQESLFGPLGIPDFYWRTGPQGDTPGGTGLLLAPRDMLKLGRLVADGGRWQGRQVVSADWVRAMIAPRVPQPDGAVYACGWWLERGLIVASGYAGQAIAIDPTRDVVVALTGADTRPGKVGMIADRVLPALDGALPAPAAPVIIDRPEPEPVPPLPALAAHVCGQTYRFAPNPFGWEALRLDFMPGAAEARVQVNAHPALPVGLDGLYRITPEGRFINWLPRVFPAALRGRWRSEDAFAIDFVELGIPEAQAVTLTFSADGAAVGVQIVDALNNEIETLSGVRQG